MAHNGTITQSEMSLLQWLAKEDFSQYGECRGKDLDALIENGFAQIHKDGSGQSGFIAKGSTEMYWAVSVTDSGNALLKQDRETIHPAA